MTSRFNETFHHLTRCTRFEEASGAERGEGSQE